MRLSLFTRTLFEPDELTCFTRDPKGTKVSSVLSFDGQNYFCINPLAATDAQPHQSWHSAAIGRRADCNVTSYRNILCEFDSGSIAEQRAIVASMPYSTLVFSGGKSLHAIISLESPCTDLASYKRLCKRIYAKLGDTVDKSASNPSRLSRCPHAMRGDVKQELLDVRKRVSASELEAWLGPDTTTKDSSDLSFSNWVRVLSPWTKDYLQWGAAPGSRNSSLFNAACDMFRAHYSYDEVLAKVSEVCDLPEHEMLTCIRSAQNATATQCGDTASTD